MKATLPTDKYSINLQMRMFPWDLGLLDWTWNILMIADYAVEPLQVIKLNLVFYEG
jgi:hypothetical protein